MEFLFIIISLVLTAGIFLLIVSSVYEFEWAPTKRAIKNHFSDETLGVLMAMILLMLALVFFIGFCAMNNTFWHCDYWTTEGLWKK
ncbi:MAG: hypothetical protein AABY15_03100 [Nanoarchaeota archaeon]